MRRLNLCFCADLAVYSLILIGLVMGCIHFFYSDHSVAFNVLESRTNEPALRQQKLHSQQDFKESKTEKQHQIEQTTKKLLLYGYLKSGATLLGELFNQNPQAAYWYEIYDAFYMSKYGLPVWNLPTEITHHPNRAPRKFQDDEVSELLHYTKRFFNCSFQALPREAVLHPMLGKSKSSKTYFECFRDHQGEGMKLCGSYTGPLCTHSVSQSISRRCPQKMAEASECIDSVGAGQSSCMDTSEPEFLEYEECVRGELSAIEECLPKLSVACHKAKIQAIKAIRFPLSLVGSLISSSPDVYIIHYVRDPRGIIASRKTSPCRERGNLLWSQNIGAEAAILCKTMLEDIRARKQLERRFPATFLTLKHEELSRDPIPAATRVYQHIGESIPDGVLNWLESSVANRSRVHAGPLSAKYDVRAGRSHGSGNAPLIRESWKQQLTSAEIVRINSNCRDVYTELEYTLD